MLNRELENTLNNAFKEAHERRYEFITLEILLLFLLDNTAAHNALLSCQSNIEELRRKLLSYVQQNTPVINHQEPREIQTTVSFQRVLQRAVLHVQNSQISKEVTGAHVLAAMFQEVDSRAVYLLRQHGIERLDILSHISHGSRVAESSDDDEVGSEAPVDEESKEKEWLARFACNLNEKAKQGKIDPLVGRQEEVMRLIQVICRRNKNNPLLVGEAGVGKTAIVEGLARRIVEQKVPDILHDGCIYSLDLGALIAGTKYRGDFEKRFKSLLENIAKKPGAILFIDEIHTVIGAGSASGGVMDASNLLKPILSGREIKCIGSTTYQEYRGIFEKDNALSRRFQKIDIQAPSIEQTVGILKGLKTRFEEHHNILYTSAALRSAAELAERHINDRQLPDKAIDVIDEAGAHQRLLPPSRRHKYIGVNDIEKIVSKIARIPPRSVSHSDVALLKNLDRDLKLLIFGQDEAIEGLSSALKMSRSGLGKADSPIGCFLFSGPTGVGKTEVTRQLARTLGIQLIRFDMSEYMERHSVSRLIGAPPGYVGFEQSGLLTEAVNKKPHAVLLLDEIEKAHPDIFNLLLQIMDHGSLTDSNGRRADFRNIILVMTTNAGATLSSRRSMGFSEQDHRSDTSEVINRNFPPEFRNRLDAIIQFNALKDERIVLAVVDKFLLELEAQLEGRRIQISADDASKLWLAQHGFDEKMGARAMARIIKEHIKKPIADEILFGQLKKGGHVHIFLRAEKSHLGIEIRPLQQAPSPA